MKSEGQEFQNPIFLKLKIISPHQRFPCTGKISIHKCIVTIQITNVYFVELYLHNVPLYLLIFDYYADIQ